MPLVGSTARDHVHDAPGPAKFGAERRGLDLEFLHPLERRRCQYVALVRAGHGTAIQENVGGVVASAIDVGGGRTTRVGRDARRQSDQVQWIAAVQREVGQLTPVDHGADGSILGGNQRGRGLYRDAFGYLADFERQVDGALLFDRQADAAANDRFEARGFGCDPVIAGRHQRERIVAVRARPGGCLDGGVDVKQRHPGGRDGGPGGVRADQAGKRGLLRQQRGSEQKQGENSHNFTPPNEY